MFFTPAAIRSMLDDRGRDRMQVPAGWLAGHTRAQVLVVPMIRFDASGHGWRCSRPARWVSISCGRLIAGPARSAGLRRECVLADRPDGPPLRRQGRRQLARAMRAQVELGAAV